MASRGSYTRPEESSWLPSVGRELTSRARGLLLPDGLQALQERLDDRLENAAIRLNEYGYDRFGFHPPTARTGMLFSALLYHYYFRVSTYDISRVPRGRVLLIGNHAGQFAWDGMMLTMSMLLDAEPPRICRGMGEYFLWRMPWMGISASRTGTVVGTPENCVTMLEGEQCVVVFPEGATGANKPFRQRYQLQKFGQGFMRLALQTHTPIVPVGIVGSEEQQPGIANLSGVGRALGWPSLPITVTAPWLGPLGIAVAFPVKYHIYFGDPLVFEGDPNDEDAAIQEKVDVVKDAMAGLLKRGLSERTGIFR